MRGIYRTRLQQALCCAAMLISTGCHTSHVRTLPLNPACPEHTMHACVRNNYGRTCGCVRTETIERFMRNRQ